MNPNINEQALVLYNNIKELVPIGNKEFVGVIDLEKVSSVQDKIQVSQLDFLITLGANQFWEINHKLDAIHNQSQTEAIITRHNQDKNNKSFNDILNLLGRTTIEVGTSKRASIQLVNTLRN